jgi:hypothetical protein
VGNTNNKPIVFDLNKLEKRFKYPKLRLKDEGTEIVEMKDEKIGIIFRNNLNIYETRSYKKIHEIKNDMHELINMIELDNYDLVLIYSTSQENYIIKIYTLKNDKYELLQIINDDRNGFNEKRERSFTFIMRFKIIRYVIKDVKKLSNNRFMIISNHGFKIYSKDKDSKYSLSFISKNESHDFINNIYVMNENELIIIYDTYNKPKFRKGNYIFEIDKFDIEKNSISQSIFSKKENEKTIFHYNINKIIPILKA